MAFKVAIVIQLIAILAMGTLCGDASAKDKQSNSLEDQLTARYKMTQTARSMASSKVTDPGTVLVVKMAGIVGVSGMTEKTCAAKFENGTLHKPGDICLQGLRMIREFTRDIAVGENVYVTKVDINEKKDNVSLEIAECDTCNGNTSTYKSTVVFQFKKGYLQTADVTEVAGVIGQVLAASTTPGDNSSAQVSAAPQPNTSSNAPPVPVASAAAPSLPAQPIQVGQTYEQVQANTGGRLELTTDLGDIKIYRYNGQRIKFENGVVTEIQ